MLRKKREIVVLLGGTSAPPIDISDWPVIDRNPRLDVCIIQVPANFDPKTINKSFHEVNFAECVRVSVNDEAIIIGFPRAHRSAVGSVINTRMLPVIDFVRSVSEERFVIADENNERQVLINPSGLQVPEHMGGASGAPVFRLMLDAKFELIGIFTGGSDGLHGVYFCAHANFVSNTGHIDTLQLPSR